MGLLDGINLNSSGGGGGLLDNLLQTLHYNTSAESPDAAQLRASPGWGPNPFTGAAASPLMQGSADMLGRGAYPVAPPMFAPRPIAQDQAAIAPQVAPAPVAVAPAPIAPPVASEAADPIAVGKYQMPRIGAADDFEPEDAAVPANAKPAQGTLPAAAPAPVTNAPSFNPLAGAFRGLMANAPAGPLGMLFGGIAGAAGMGEGTPAQQQAQIANVTANALRAKGVDETTIQAAKSNPEVMKTLITQHFGPQTIQPLGSGYIADKNGKITRAYEPEDKIPAGFAKGEDGSMHFIPGGPSDPAYARLLATEGKDPKGNYVLGKGGEVIKNNPDGTVSVIHRNQEDPTPMDPSSLEILARREIGGDFSGRKNLGRGAQGAADLRAITNKSSNILTDEMGMSPKDAATHMLQKQQEFNAQGQGLNAEARTTGVREANLNLILKAADAAIPAALEASDKVARTGWVPLNRIIQHGEVMASDPDLKKFGMANLQLAEHWARAMNPTGVMRGEDRDIALSFLGTADSKETYRTAVEQLHTQITRERDAVKSSRGMSELPGNASAPQAAAAPGAAPAAAATVLPPGKYTWSPTGGVTGGAK